VDPDLDHAVSQRPPEPGNLRRPLGPDDSEPGPDPRGRGL
ncbi:hypothetical protein AVDCRST_MAG82-656, partial [uncultured Rubrobacteraceae bacterium]